MKGYKTLPKKIATILKSIGILFIELALLAWSAFSALLARHKKASAGIAAVVVILSGSIGGWLLYKKYVPVDYGIEKNLIGDYTYENRNEEFSVSFIDKKRKDQPWVRFESGKGALNMSFLLADGRPVEFDEKKVTVEKDKEKSKWYVGKDKMTIENVLPETDLTYEIIDKGVKEEVVLKSDQAVKDLTSDPVYRFALEADNVEPQALVEGSYTPNFRYKDDNGYAFHVLKPVMIDAAGARSEEIAVFIRPTSDSNQATTEWEGKLSAFDFESPFNIPTVKAEGKQAGYALVFKPSLAWLKDSSRKFPIRIDPSVVHDTESEFDAGTVLNRVDSASGPQVQIDNPVGGNDKYTKLLLHADGNNNSTTFSDLAMAINRGKSFTTYADAKISTTQSKFGGSSMYFDGTGDYALTSDSDDWNSGPGDFTVDFWVRPSQTSTQMCAFSHEEADYYPANFFEVISNQFRWVMRKTSGGNGDIFDMYSTGVTVTSNTWYHIALVKKGTSYKMYVDGTERGSTTSSTVPEDAATHFILGARTGGASTYWYGYIDEFRVSKGIARWTSNFTPPTKAYDGEKAYGVYTSSVIDSGARDTDWTQIQWTENGVTTGDGETLKDATNLVAQWNFNDGTAAQNITTLTNNAGSCGASCNGTLNGFDAGATTGLDGSATEGWTANNGRWPNNSPEALMFDGSNDYVDAGNSVQSLTNLSLESWIKLKELGRAQTIVSRWGTTADTTAGYELIVDSNNKLRFDLSSTGGDVTNLFSKTVLKSGEWYHVVGSYDGSSMKVYINGTLDNSSVYSSGVNNPAGIPLGIGNFYYQVANPWNYPSNLRLNGVIDSTRIYSRALSANEILSNYNAGNVEIQTRSGATANPEDGTWDDWKPTHASAETAVDAMDSGNASDNYSDGYTKLLLHANGTNNSSTFYDDSKPPKTTSTFGDAKLSTTQSKFGGSSAYFDGAGDYISIPASSDWNFSTGDFTVDFWIYPTGALNDKDFLDFGSDITKDARLMFWNNKLYFFDNDTPSCNLLDPSEIALNAWSHYAVVRNGTNLTIYRDGNSVATSSTCKSAIGSSTQALFVGARLDYGTWFTGYLDELRISKGVARWTGNFTPPTVQYGDPNYLASSNGNIGDKMKLLMHGDGGDGSTTFTDSSVYSKTAIANGDAHIEQDQSKFGGTSMYFDGTGDYVAVPDSNDWNFGNGDFTMDCWVKRDSTGLKRLFGQTGSAGTNASTSIVVYFDAGNHLAAYFAYGNSAVAAISTGTITDSSWHHIAAIRNGNTLRTYIDGVNDGSADVTGLSMNDSSATFSIGRHGDFDDSYFNGYIDELRLSKGIARWTENFTPETSAYTNPIAANNPVKMEGAADMKISQGTPQCNASTVALWHLDETGATNYNSFFADACGGYYGTPSGSGFSLVDGWSGKARSFNGSNDYISVPGSGSGSSLDITGGNITVSVWIKTTQSTTGGILNKYSSGAGGYLILIDGSRIHFYTGSGYRNVSSNTTLNDNQWHHIVGVINGGTMNMYVDGIKQTSQDHGVSIVSTAQTFELGRYSGGNYFSGYIDEPAVYNQPLTAETIAEMYRAGRDNRITRTFATTDFSGKTKLPFYVAGDRSGTYLEATVGESAYVNNEVDTNTVGLWHMDDQEEVVAPSATKLLMHMDNGNGSQTFIDSSAVGRTITVSGGAQQSTSQIKFGASSGYFNGATTSYVSMASNNDFNFGTGDFTIDGWFKWEGAGNANGRLFSTPSGYSAYLNDVNADQLYAFGLGPFTWTKNSNWNHWAFVRYNGNLTVYLNGSSLGTVACATDYSNVGIFYLGYLTGNNTTWLGYIDEFRISKGVARWKTNFTPSSSAYSATASPKDSASMNSDPVVSGTTSVEGKIGKARKFNGTSDFIDLGYGPRIRQTSTLSWWGKVNPGGGGYFVEQEFWNDSNNFWSFMPGVRTDNGKIQMWAYSYNGGVRTDMNVEANGDFRDGLWHKYDMVFVNGTASFYLDGQYRGSSTPGFTAWDSATNASVMLVGKTCAYWYGGCSTAVDYFNGQIDEVRLDNIARSADEIRQAYEIDKRTYPVTIDFSGRLSSGNLITGSADLSFTVGTANGLAVSALNPMKLYVGDKVIVKEIYDGQEYLAQGTVTAASSASGAVTVASWDSGSTFPSGGQTGFGANATVFKWQKEYWDISAPLDSHLNAATQVTLRVTDGNEARNIYVDDLKSFTNLLTDPAATENITSLNNRYFQYRTIFSTADRNVTPYLSQVTASYNLDEAYSSWRLDENSGDTVYDSGLYNNDGTLGAGVAANKPVRRGEEYCVFGKCLEFDGLNDDVVIADSDYVSPLTEFSISAWVKPLGASAATQAILVKDGSYRIATDGSSHPVCQIHNGTAWQTAATSSVTLTIGEWQNVSCTYSQSASSLKVYVNGVERGSQSLVVTIANNSNNLVIGKDAGGTYDELRGFVDEVKLYNGTAKNAEQVRAEYHAGSSTSTSTSGSSLVVGGASDPTVIAGLMGWWKMDEDNWDGTASEVVDASGSSNHGTASGAIVASGKFGNAGSFDGTDDVVTVAAGAGANMYGSSGYTVCGWIKPTGGGEGGAGEWFSKGNSYVRVDTESGGTVKVSASFDLATADASYTTTSTIPVNQWSQVCASWRDDSDDELDVYVNGTLVGTSTNGEGSLSDDSAVALYIGGDSSNNFAGLVDDLRVYNKGLTAGKVTELYNLAPNMVIHLKLDDKTGTTAQDSSGHGNNGTLYNGPTWDEGKQGSGVRLDGSNDYVGVPDFEF